MFRPMLKALKLKRNCGISKFSSSILDTHNIFDSNVIGLDRKMNITGFGDKAFKVNDKLISQSILLLPRSVYLWKANTFADITIESLSMYESIMILFSNTYFKLYISRFTLVYPTIEILFIGNRYFCSLKSYFVAHISILKFHYLYL